MIELGRGQDDGKWGGNDVNWGVGMTMTTRAMAVVLVALGTLASRDAWAGLLDSPPPSFGSGVPSKVVYRMGPVHYDPGWADTVVSCSSLASAPVDVAIELFNGTDEAAGLVTRATIQPGGQVVFATSADAGGAGAVPVLDLAPMENGKARVSATSSQLSCSGRQRIRSSDGGTKEFPFELIKKVARDD